jgi:hypothetical protein
MSGGTLWESSVNAFDHNGRRLDDLDFMRYRIAAKAHVPDGDGYGFIGADDVPICGFVPLDTTKPQHVCVVGNVARTKEAAKKLYRPMSDLLASSMVRA